MIAAIESSSGRYVINTVGGLVDLVTSRYGMDPEAVHKRMEAASDGTDAVKSCLEYLQAIGIKFELGEQGREYLKYGLTTIPTHMGVNWRRST